jgi:hypothetical protein
MILSDEYNVFPVLAPVDTNNTAVGTDVVDAGDNQWLTFCLQIGNIAGDATLTVEECDNTTPSTTAAIAFNYRLSAAVGTNTLGALTACASTGLSLANATYDNKMVIVEVDPASLDDGYPYVRLYVTPANSATLVSCVCIAKPRYNSAVMNSSVD